MKKQERGGGKGRGLLLPNALPIGKNNGRKDEGKRHPMVPFGGFTQHKKGKNDKHRDRNDFLNNFKLSGGESAIPQTVRGYLKTIFKKGNSPTQQNNKNHAVFLPLKKFEMPNFDAHEMARNIALDIESKLNYPWEVKVNLIREMRVIEYAK